LLRCSDRPQTESSAANGADYYEQVLQMIRILKRYFTAMSDIRFLHRASGASRKTGVGFMHPLRGFQDFVIEMLSHNPFPPHFFY
jgi:hypothetical protein